MESSVGLVNDFDLSKLHDDLFHMRMQVAILRKDLEETKIKLARCVWDLNNMIRKFKKLEKGCNE